MVEGFVGFVFRYDNIQRKEVGYFILCFFFGDYEFFNRSFQKIVFYYFISQMGYMYILELIISKGCGIICFGLD